MEEIEDWSEDELVQVELPNPDYFNRVKETLTRIGICNVRDKKLWQTCHIIEQNGLYYIVHFKEVFLLQGKEANLEDDDIARRNCIIDMLQTWNLVKAVSPIPFNKEDRPRIFVLKYAEKKDWKLYNKVEV